MSPKLTEISLMIYVIYDDMNKMRFFEGCRIYLGKDLDLRMMKVRRRRFPSLSWLNLPSQNESSFFDTSASFSLSCTLVGDG